MHTLVTIFGVVVSIILVTAIVSMIVGVIWIIYPLKNRLDMDRYTTPLGGRETGAIILVAGIAGLIIGFALDRIQSRLAKQYGSRI